MAGRAVLVAIATAIAVVSGAGCQRTPRPQASLTAAPAPDPDAPRSSDDDRAQLRWTLVPARLPTAVGNNAVAAVTIERETVLVSMMGLSGDKGYADIVRLTAVLRPGAPSFDVGRPTPGDQGRLASAAVGWGEDVLLFGGYTVAPDGHEVSRPEVQRYDVATDHWATVGAMPVPVDDAVVARYGERIVVVSGWSNVDNVADVQLFAPATGTWSSATPIVGPPVFGHAGGVLGDSIIYCDGVEKVPEVGYRAVDGCFAGAIDREHPETIAWSAIAPHPGAARYRMAAGSMPGLGWLVFAGGTANPYNYDGIGYDGSPSQPVRDVFAWDGERWRTLPPLPEALMDHRGLVAADGALFLVGGLDAQRQPSDRVYRLGPHDAATQHR